MLMGCITHRLTPKKACEIRIGICGDERRPWGAFCKDTSYDVLPDSMSKGFKEALEVFLSSCRAVSGLCTTGVAEDVRATVQMFKDLESASRQELDRVRSLFREGKATHRDVFEALQVHLDYWLKSDALSAPSVRKKVLI
jgi:hypothetical protein